MRTRQEIEAQRDEAGAAIAGEREGFPGLSYEEGVDNALAWVLNEDDTDAPMEA